LSGQRRLVGGKGGEREAGNILAFAPPNHRRRHGRGCFPPRGHRAGRRCDDGFQRQLILRRRCKSAGLFFEDQNCGFEEFVKQVAKLQGIERERLIDLVGRRPAKTILPEIAQGIAQQL
jgi:hypothetical protein